MSEPLRTCIGCRLRDNPRNMLRIVRFGGDGERMRILPDVHPVAVRGCICVNPASNRLFVKMLSPAPLKFQLLAQTLWF